MRLIDGDRLEDALREHKFCYSGETEYNDGVVEGLMMARDDVIEAPTIEAEPIKIGHWIEKGNGIAECDVCNRQNLYRQDGVGVCTKYCPSCGARMEW